MVILAQAGRIRLLFLSLYDKIPLALLALSIQVLLYLRIMEIQCQHGRS